MLLLGCAYADGCFTAEETILAAYFRGKCIQESSLPPGRHSHQYQKLIFLWQRWYGRCWFDLV